MNKEINKKRISLKKLLKEGNFLVELCCFVTIATCCIVMLFALYLDNMADAIQVVLVLYTLFIGTVYVYLTLNYRDFFGNECVYIGILIFFMLLSFIINGFKGVTMIASIVSFILGLSIFTKFSIGARAVLISLLVVIALAIFLSLNSFSPFLDVYPADKFNPNTVCFFVSLISMCIVVMGLKNNKYFLLLIPSFIALFYFSSRTSMFALLFFILAMFIFRKIKMLKKPSLIVAIALFSAVVFAYFYAVVLFECIGRGSITILGKDIFTGREIIWQDIFEQIQGNYILGIGNLFNADKADININLVSGHNSMMHIMIFFGVPAMIFFGLTVAKIVNQGAKNSLISKHCLIGLLAIILMSYLDVILLSYYNTLIILISIILLNSICKIPLCNDRSEK